MYNQLRKHCVGYEWRLLTQWVKIRHILGNGRDLGVSHTNGCGAPEDAGIFLPLKIFYGPKARLNYIKEVYRLLWTKHYKN